MGRPLNRRFFGDPSSIGNQLNVEAWIPGGVGVVSAWIDNQKSNTTYTVTDGTDTGRCKLQQESITGPGQMRIEVMPFGFDAATGTATMLAVSEASTDEAPAGSGYEPGDTVTLTGGTFSTAVILNVNSVGLQSGTIVAGGSGFSAADTLTVPASEGSAGTVDVDEVFTIATQTETNFDGGGSNGTFAAGTGYSIGDTITLTDGTIIDVDSEGGSGDVTTFNILSATSGTGPTSDGATLTQSSTTGGGSGFTLTLGTDNQAVGTVLVVTNGNYTTLLANPVSMTGGTGTGATITALYGSLGVTINTAGDYSVIPADPVAQGSTSGSGSGALFIIGWGVLAVAVTDGGSGYLAAPTVSFTGGSGTTATATLTGDAVTSVSVGAPGGGYSITATVSFAAAAGDMEYAKILNSRQVKTFEGNVYSWDFIKVAVTDNEADLDFS